MPGFQAKKLCPDGIFVPNRRRVYSEFSHKVFAILERYSPEVHAVSIDEGIVDLTGTDRLFGPPLKTADQIIRRIETELGLPSSAGLSQSRVVSKIAATLAKPRGLIYVPPGSEKEFLIPLAVELIPGVGPKTHKLFSRKEIKPSVIYSSGRSWQRAFWISTKLSGENGVMITPLAMKPLWTNRSETKNRWKPCCGIWWKRWAVGYAERSFMPAASR